MPTNFRLAYNSDGLNYTDLFPRTSMSAIIDGGNAYQITALDVDIPVPSDSSITQTIAITTTQEMVDAVFRMYLISTGDQAEEDYATITQAEVQENQLVITRLYNMPSDEIAVRLLFFEKGMSEIGGGDEPGPGPDPEPVTLVSIAVTTNPNKLDYNVGEVFNPEGMVVTATYSDNHQEVVTGYTYLPNTALTEDNTTITISYTEDDTTVETTLTITVTEVVVPPSETPVSLTLVSDPDETEYIGGEDVDLTGIQLRVQYEDQSEKVVGPENVTYSFPEQVAMLSTMSTLATNSTESLYTKPIIYSYTESDITVSCESTIVMQDEPDPILENNLWKMISKVSSESKGREYWNIGDEKIVKMSGGYIEDDYIIPEGETADIYAVIIDFDHNSEIEGTGITFLLMGKDSETGHETFFRGQSYNTIQSSLRNFKMHFTDTGYVEGWRGSEMRFDILGSTRVGSSRLETPSDTATNPIPNSFMSKLDENVRKYMKPITIYTTNDAPVTNDYEVNATIDYLPLLSEIEVFGECTYSNPDESQYQVHYSEYFNNHNALKYQFQNPNELGMYFLRSPWITVPRYNIVVYDGNDNGQPSSGVIDGRTTLGFLPIFRI